MKINFISGFGSMELNLAGEDAKHVETFMPPSFYELYAQDKLNALIKQTVHFILNVNFLN
jgi:hypothetical protein